MALKSFTYVAILDLCCYFDQFELMLRNEASRPNLRI
jgi:hypothetical protein